MKTVTLRFPETANIDEKDLKSMLAAKLYEKGTLTLGQAAEFAGYSKRTFMEILGDYDVSVFNQLPNDLENDILNAKNYHL